VYADTKLKISFLLIWFWRAKKVFIGEITNNKGYDTMTTSYHTLTSRCSEFKLSTSCQLD